MQESVWSHYHQWWAAALFALVGLVFLAFLPFYR